MPAGGQNARLLADELASNGFYVVVPDLFKSEFKDIWGCCVADCG